jgi:16S rRNA (guanine(966)-N(2))-methyltransferase RsmD
MRTQLRIVAGSLRGRKLTCDVNPQVRPAPQRVREALFSILGNAVPDRPFFDLFAGTGAVGLEALSRGARPVVFVECDFRVAGQIQKHLSAFDVADRASIIRADVYPWAERWQPPAEPVTLFLGPPFADFEQRPDSLVTLVADLQTKVAGDSVLVLQSETPFQVGQLPGARAWDVRQYGRNQLMIWVKESLVRGE